MYLRLTPSNVSQQKMKEASNFRSALNRMRIQEKFTDIQLCCDNKVFPAHRVVLASKSKYFEDFFEKEVNDDATDILIVRDSDPEIIGHLLDFMYTGEINFTKMSPEKLHRFILTGKKMGMDDFLYHCRKLISEKLSLSNFAHILEIAQFLSDIELEDQITTFIVNNLDIMWTMTKFLSLSKEDVEKIACRALASQSHSQDVILRALLSWIKHDMPHRQNDVTTLTKSIKFDALSESYIRYLLDEDPLIRDCPSMQSILLQIAANNLENLQLIGLVKGLQLQKSTKDSEILGRLIPEAPRFLDGPKSPTLTIIANDALISLHIVHYNLEKNEWTNPEPIDFSLPPTAGVLYKGGLLFIIGGEDPELKVKSDACCVHDILQATTVPLPSLQVARGMALIYLLNGSLYAAGGIRQSSSTPINHVERLESLHQPMWQNVLPMLHSCDSTASMCILHDSLFIMTSNKCQCFFIKTKSWHDFPNLKSKGEMWLLVACNGQLFAIEKSKGNKMFLLDQTELAWNQVAVSGDAPSALIHATSWQNKILVLDDQFLLHEYDVNAKAWHFLNSIPKNLCQVCLFCCEE